VKGGQFDFFGGWDMTRQERASLSSLLDVRHAMGGSMCPTISVSKLIYFADETLQGLGAGIGRRRGSLGYRGYWKAALEVQTLTPHVADRCASRSQMG